MHDEIELLNKQGKKSNKGPVKICERDFKIWISCVRKSLDELKYAPDIQEEFVQVLNNQQQYVCQMEDIRNQFTHCLR